MGHLYHGYVTNNQRVFTLNGKCGTWKSSDFPWFSHLSTSISLRNFTLFMFDDTGSGNASWKPGILSRRLPGLSFSVKNPRLDVHPSYLLLFWLKQKYTEYRAYMTNTIIYLDIYDPYIYSDEQLLWTYFGKKKRLFIRAGRTFLVSHLEHWEVTSLRTWWESIHHLDRTQIWTLRTCLGQWW